MPQNYTQNSTGWKKYPFKKLVIKKMCKLPVLRILWKSLHSRDWLMISFFTGAALNRRGFYSSLFLYQHFKATILQWWDLALKGSLKVKVQAKKSTCPKLFLFSVTRMHLRVFCPENFPLDFIQYCITLFFYPKIVRMKVWAVKRQVQNVHPGKYTY